MKIKYLLYLLIAIGVSITVYALWEIFQTTAKTNETLEMAKKVISESSSEKESVEEFSPDRGDVIGLLVIPKIDVELAIVEGTNPDELEKGVGHYEGSYFPNETGQIVLSGHRDTVFRKLGDLKIEDELLVEMPYGKFSYKIIRTKIVDKDDKTIITLQNENEELIVTTCYPFRYIGDAPQRYIIYAERQEP